MILKKNGKKHLAIHVKIFRKIKFHQKFFFRNLRVFHFHDTSSTAEVKRVCNVNDNRFLREDAGNLAAFLYGLSQSHPKHFNIIEKTIQSVAPFFNRFDFF